MSEFTSNEIRNLVRIYQTACRDGAVIINCIGGNIYWRLRGKPERKELTEILKRQFKSWFHIDWNIVATAMGTEMEDSHDKVNRSIH